MNEEQITKKMNNLTIKYKSNRININKYMKKQIKLMDSALKLPLSKVKRTHIKLQRLAVKQMYKTIKKLKGVKRK